MRKRKFIKKHSYGITAVLILTALMVGQRRATGSAGNG